jgi:hypothetical protein
MIIFNLYFIVWSIRYVEMWRVDDTMFTKESSDIFFGPERND